MKRIDYLVQHFREAHQALPRLYCVLAKIYGSQERLSETKEIYLRVINQMKLKPEEYYTDLIDAELALSDIYMKVREHFKAERAVMSAIDVIQMRPEELHQNLTNAYFRLEIFTDSRRDIRKQSY